MTKRSLPEELRKAAADVFNDGSISYLAGLAKGSADVIEILEGKSAPPDIEPDDVQDKMGAALKSMVYQCLNQMPGDYDWRRASQVLRAIATKLQEDE